MTEPIRAGSLSGSFSAELGAASGEVLARYLKSRMGSARARTASLTLAPPGGDPTRCPQCAQPVEGLRLDGCTTTEPIAEGPMEPGRKYQVNLRAGSVVAKPCGCVLAVDPVQYLRAMGVTVTELPYGAEPAPETGESP